MTHRIEAEELSPQSNTVFIGIGSNMGDRLGFCRKAVSALRDHAAVRVIRVSSLYESDPVDFLEQGRFFNAVLTIETRLSPQSLLHCCQGIETSLGKKIDIPKGPRTIDLDLLFYNDLIMDAPELILPHPGAAHRAFVLVPLLEIAPRFTHPRLSQTAHELLAGLERVGKTGVEKYLGPGWETERAA
ncbi:MAG: 2-amino-4-hydroxy-6-hydroxymethyldihydropteridine diphosphokinase [Nitrospiria bacterium]